MSSLRELAQVVSDSNGHDEAAWLKLERFLGRDIPGVYIYTDVRTRRECVATLLSALDAETRWRGMGTAPTKTLCLVQHVAFDSVHVALAEHEGHEDPGYWTSEDGTALRPIAWAPLPKEAE